MNKVVGGAPAVILVSGGLDSAVALGVAVREGYTCHALSFDYGQRHRCELEAAAKVSRQVGAADHKIVFVGLRAIGGSALTADIDVPKDRTEAEIGGQELPATYVPARNLIFLSLAAGYAQTLKAWDVFIGVNCVDYSGYPDCRWPFIDAFNKAANFATGVWDDRNKQTLKRTGLTVHAPLVNHTKVQIIQMAKKLNVDLSLTHSCYDPDARGLACGRCDSCLIRRKGFEVAGVPDPTRYQSAGVRR
jgi:7-cyano-7-deazaguanine synthase